MGLDNMPCITCQNSLRDYGKITPDWQWAYCTICGARYEVIAATDEYGWPIEAADGHQNFYLNPVKPGDSKFYKESDDSIEDEKNENEKFVDDVDSITDFGKLKSTIQNIDTVEEFINSLKTL